MFDRDFFTSLGLLAEEKGIKKGVIISALEDALRAAYRREYGHRDQEIDVKINEKLGNVTVYLVKEVVKDIEEEWTEIDLKEAKKYDKNIEVGETLRIDVTPQNYGRIAAQSARQVLLQKLREEEKNVLYDEFSQRIGDILVGQVKTINNNTVYIDLGKVVAILKENDQIPGERYYVGQRLKGYLYKVVDANRSPLIFISRSNTEFIEALLTLEIPEIADNEITIKSIAREPGVRTKIAVESSSDKVDPVGACVGQNGLRIQGIIDEINREFIDIIQWTDDTKKLIKTCLAPSEITEIILNQKAKKALVFLPEEQRSYAIGKKGQNVKLASMLTSFDIDIITDSKLDEYKEMIIKYKEEEAVAREEAEKDAEEIERERRKKVREDEKKSKELELEKSRQKTQKEEEIIEEDKKEEKVDNSLETLNLDKKIIKALAEVGIEEVELLKEMTEEQLSMIDGIGPKAIEKIMAVIK